MKLSKISRTFMAMGILVIIAASLWVAHSQQVNELTRLQKELDVAEMRLSSFKPDQLTSQKEELEKQLSQTISQVEAAKAMLSQPNDSITASASLLNIAQTCGVEIVEISSSSLVTEDLEGITCYALPLTLTVKGNISSLISFIAQLNDNLTTGVVNSVEIRTPARDRGAGEGEQQEEKQTQEQESPSADISLIIYTYQGS